MRNRLLLESPKRTNIMSTMLIAFFSMVSMVSTFGQCTADGTSPTFFGCDTDQTIQLAPGQCSVYLQPSIFATDNCLTPTLTFSNGGFNNPTFNIVCDYGPIEAVQFFKSTSNTPMEISSVEIYVVDLIEAYLVPINVYKTNGSLNSDDWERIGGGSASAGVGTGYNLTINTSTSYIDPNEEFAVEIVGPASLNGNVLIGFDQGNSPSGTTYVRTRACSSSSYATIDAATGSNDGNVYMNIIGSAIPVVINPINGTVQEVTDQFGAGSYALSYEAVDAAGNDATCAFNLTVAPVANPVSSISCNDLVNISLDGECMAVVSPDEILEGGPYSCYDDYTVVIYNEMNQPIGDTLTSEYVGSTLKVEVTAPNNNECWGEVRVEDKAAPVLDCFDVYTTCSGDLAPGSSLPMNITYSADIKNDKIGAGLPSINEYYIDVFGLQNVTYRDLNVRLDIDHDRVSDLVINLESPTGKIIKLINGINCKNQGLMVLLDDEASSDYSSLVDTCGPVAPAVRGTFKAAESLNAAMSEDPTGTWKLRIIDEVEDFGGIVKGLSIVFKQEGGSIPFPTMNMITSSVEVGPNTYRVEGLDPCGPATVSYVDSIAEMDCDSKYLRIIKRKWSAVDAQGNAAIPCDQYIYVYRNGLETLVFPPNFDGIDEPSFSCEEYGMSVPKPIDGEAGYPEGDFCENIQIFEPEDIKIDICAKSYKLIRKWRVLEWCSGTVVEHTQIIKVEDKNGPEIICTNEDQVFSTDALECTKDYEPIPPMVTDNGCTADDDIDVVLSYYFSADGTVPTGAIFTVEPTSTIDDLPLGKTFIRYTATDDCGNSSTCQYMVTIEDNVPPVAVCDQFTNVTVGSDGNAWVDAITFDDISYDNCSNVTFEARKMRNKCQGGNTSFSEKVLFCCDEIGDEVMVALKVTDSEGNENTCMVEVKVEDKLPPYIECPRDTVLDCTDDYKDLDLTGMPDAIDNCMIDSVEPSYRGNVDRCGEGVITITWTAKEKDYDGNGGASPKTASCEQRITLENSDPFEERDIRFPRDIERTTCGTDLTPEGLNSYPDIDEKNCSQIAYDYEDQVFTFVEDACVKILRTWTVIDWCTYDQGNINDPNDDRGIYTDVQIIVLKNNEKPVFDNCPSSRTVDVFEDCRGEVMQEVNATDVCTPDSLLKYHYEIDENNDGVGTPISGVGKSFNRVLEIGEHKVTWYVEDLCGNVEMCMYVLRVRDGKKPTPYCLTTVTTVVMPSTKEIEIWASDFDYGSYDNCTPIDELTFSFTSNRSDTKQTFSCDDIIDGQEQYIEITMWVHDNANNKDFCTIGLILQDGIGDVCEEQERHAISGRISTEDDEPIKDARIMALTLANETMVSNEMSSANGTYDVSVSAGSDVKVASEKEDRVMNGISTLDLVLIQRHILAINPFVTPYKVIAADVNNDSKISASDLVALRKVILGIESIFPNNQKPWRFVDSEQTFANDSKPFPFSEDLVFEGINSQETQADFIGVKIGDVNGSVQLNFREDDTENRSANDLELTYDQEVSNGYQLIHVYAENTITISGVQAAFEIANNEILDIQAGDLSIKSSDFVINNGKLKLSYAAKNNVNVVAGTKLFTVVSPVSNDKADLQIASELSGEAYDEQYEVHELKLTSRNEVETFGFNLMQNKPNPFSDYTVIDFTLPNTGEVSINVYDVTGKVVFEYAKEFSKGNHSFDLYDNQLGGASGVMYYEISFEGKRMVKKMVNLK